MAIGCNLELVSVIDVHVHQCLRYSWFPCAAVVLRRDHPNVKIIAYDHNKDHLLAWTKTMLADANATQYLDGIGFHWYALLFNRLPCTCQRWFRSDLMYISLSTYPPTYGDTLSLFQRPPTGLGPVA